MSFRDRLRQSIIATRPQCEGARESLRRHCAAKGLAGGDPEQGDAESIDSRSTADWQEEQEELVQQLTSLGSYVVDPHRRTLPQKDVVCQDWPNSKISPEFDAPLANTDKPILAAKMAIRMSTIPGPMLSQVGLRVGELLPKGKPLIPSQHADAWTTSHLTQQGTLQQSYNLRPAGSFSIKIPQSLMKVTASRVTQDHLAGWTTYEGDLPDPEILGRKAKVFDYTRLSQWIAEHGPWTSPEEFVRKMKAEFPGAEVRSHPPSQKVVRVWEKATGLTFRPGIPLTPDLPPASACQYNEPLPNTGVFAAPNPEPSMINSGIIEGFNIIENMQPANADAYVQPATFADGKRPARELPAWVLTHLGAGFLTDGNGYKTTVSHPYLAYWGGELVVLVFGAQHQIHPVRPGDAPMVSRGFINNFVDLPSIKVYNLGAPPVLGAPCHFANPTAWLSGLRSKLRSLDLGTLDGDTPEAAVVHKTIRPRPFPFKTGVFLKRSGANWQACGFVNGAFRQGPIVEAARVHGAPDDTFTNIYFRVPRISDFGHYDLAQSFWFLNLTAPEAPPVPITDFALGAPNKGPRSRRNSQASYRSRSRSKSTSNRPQNDRRRSRSQSERPGGRRPARQPSRSRSANRRNSRRPNNNNQQGRNARLCNR